MSNLSANVRSGANRRTQTMMFDFIGLPLASFLVNWLIGFVPLSSRKRNVTATNNCPERTVTRVIAKGIE